MGLPARTGFREWILASDWYTPGGSGGLSSATDTTNGALLPCTNFGVTPRQQVTAVSAVRGHIDNYIFQVGPHVVEGTVEFPLMLDLTGVTTVGSITGGIHTSVDRILSAVNNANDPATLYNVFDIATTLHGTYKAAMLNNLTIRAAHGGQATCTADVWPQYLDPGTGVAGDSVTYVSAAENIPVGAAPTEVVMFYHINVSGLSLGSLDLSSCNLRQVTLTINNNLIRNFTFCGKEWAHDVTHGERQVSVQLVYQIDYDSGINLAGGSRYPLFADIDPNGVTIDFGPYRFTINNIAASAAAVPLPTGVIELTVDMIGLADPQDGNSSFALVYTPNASWSWQWDS